MLWGVELALMRSSCAGEEAPPRVLDISSRALAKGGGSVQLRYLHNTACHHHQKELIAPLLVNPSLFPRFLSPETLPLASWYQDSVVLCFQTLIRGSKVSALHWEYL